LRGALWLTLLALGCATRLPPIDPGAIRGDTWESTELGLAATLPEGWAFLAPEEIEAGLRGEAKHMPRALRPSKRELDRTTTLFAMVDRSHATAPGPVRRGMLAHAQPVADPPAGLTSEAIATDLERQLLALEIPIEIGVRRHTIVAGRRFVVVPTVLTQEGVRARIDHHLRYEPGRLLVLTLTYPPEEQTPPQEAIEAIHAFRTDPPGGAP
jgi:hypothetical protein